MKDRDLENFAKYFTATLHTGMGHVDAYYKRKNDIIIADAKRRQDAIKEAREDRRTNQWIEQSKAYMDYLNKRGAAAGMKGGRGGGGANTGSVFDNIVANDGVDTGGTPAAPVVYQTNTFEQPDAAPPGHYPFNRGGKVPRFNNGGVMDLETAMRGGPGGKKNNEMANAASAASSAGESALGGAIGRWMAKQNQPLPGSGETFNRGGSVGAIQTAPPRQRFQDGGIALPPTDRYYKDPVSGLLLRRDPNEAPPAPGGDPYAEQRRAEDQAFDAGSRNRTSPPPSNRAGVEPPPGQHVVDSIERQRINEYWRANTPSNPSGEQRTHGTMVGPGGTADVDPGAHRDWDPRSTGRSGTAGMTEPDVPPQGEEEPQAMGAVTVSAQRPRGGGGRGGPEPWKKLGDQTRTKAYDYEKDYGDERNMRAVDRWGRSRQTGPAPAAAQRPQRAVDLSGGPMGGQGRDPQGSGGPRAGMSTNNAANDYEAAQGAANFAEHTFELGAPSKNSAGGYEALAKGHGAPSPQTIEQMRRTVDPEGKLPPNEMMRQLRNKVYEFYMSQGDKAKADKTAFEVSQFGNVMAKGHGANAQKLMAKGDMAGAVNEIAAGYNWLPNGHTVSIDPSGRNAVIEGPDGKVVQQIPLTPDIIKQVSAGMAHGVFNWDVMNGGGPLPAPGLNGPQLGPQPDRGGGGGGGQAISPTLPPPVRSPATAAQPAAAPAGPPAPPQAASPSAPAAAPTSGGPGGVPGAPAAAPPAAPPTAVTPSVPPALTPAPAPTTPRMPSQTTVPSVAPATRPQTKPAPQAQAQPTPPAVPAAPAAPAPAQAVQKTAPAAPAAPATTTAKEPSVAERRAAIRGKEPTDEERAAALEKKYKDNPDYIPNSLETPPIRRGSRDTQPINPREWRHRAQEAEFDLEQKLKLVADAKAANIKATGKAPPAASVAKAIKHYNDIYERRIREIKEDKKAHDDAQSKLDSQESARIDNRKIQSAAPDTTVHKVINAEIKKVADKYLKVTNHEKEAAKGRDADQSWAAVRNSPLRYMGTEEARARLGDVARQIWQANGMPDMSEKQAVDLAILATSFVAGNEKGRTYRNVGYDTLGNVVIQTKGGDVAHVPKQTLGAIENLRKANLKKFEEEEEDRKSGRNQVSSTRKIIEGAGKEIRKHVNPVDPISGGIRAAGELIGKATKKDE